MTDVLSDAPLPVPKHKTKHKVVYPDAAVSLSNFKDPILAVTPIRRFHLTQ